GEWDGWEHRGTCDLGAPNPFQSQHRECRREDQGRRYACTRRYLPGLAALALQPCVEPPSDVAWGLDCPRGLHRKDAAPHGRVAPSATGAAPAGACRTAQPPWRGGE